MKSAALVILVASMGLPPMTGDPEALLKQRVVLVDSVIEDKSAKEAMAKLLFLEHGSALEPVYIVVDSPGGSAVAALAMADTIQGLKSPVHTICRGEAGGAAVLLLASGRHGLRHAARSCSVRVAAQSGPGALPGSGKARREIVARLSLLSGQPVSSIEDAIARREVMSAERAHAYGLVDDVLSDANAR